MTNVKRSKALIAAKATFWAFEAKFSNLILTKSAMTDFYKVGRVAFWTTVLKTVLKRLQKKRAIQGECGHELSFICVCVYVCFCCVTEEHERNPRSSQVTTGPSKCLLTYSPQPRFQLHAPTTGPFTSFFNLQIFKIIHSSCYSRMSIKCNFDVWLTVHRNSVWIRKTN